MANMYNQGPIPQQYTGHSDAATNMTHPYPQEHHSVASHPESHMPMRTAATPAPPYDANSYNYHNPGVMPQHYPPHPEQAQHLQHQQSFPPQQPQHQQSYPPQQPYPVQHEQKPAVYATTSPVMHESKPYPVEQVHQMQQPQQYGQPVGGRFETAVPLQSIGMAPAPVDCPVCKHRALTRTEKHSGNTTHAWAFITCCVTGCLCFIPYLMDGLKDVEHYCGSCNTHLANWHKSGKVEVLVHG